MATATTTMSARTLTSTWRVTSALSRLGATTLRIPIGSLYSTTDQVPGGLKARQDPLPLGSLHEVEEGLDRGLHLRGVGVHDEVERAAHLVLAADQVLPCGADRVDRGERDLRVG